MKKFSRYGALLILLASFSAPILASAQNSDGCSSTGPSCTNSGGYRGSCAESPDTGYFYCKPDILRPQTSGSSGGSGGININVIKPYSDSIIGIINSIFVPVLMAIAFIVFLWGVFKYFIWNKESESEKMEGRKFAMWGIIGFVIILSVWGLVNILMGALNLQGGKPPPFPKI